jgi:hypothetical protein
VGNHDRVGCHRCEAVVAFLFYQETETY